jgi:PAS domain S-box-containing protein
MRRRLRELESANAELERALEDLRKGAEGHLQCGRSETEAIISADSEGNIISWNEGAQAIFGYTEGEILGKHLGLLMPEGYREGYQKGLRRMAATGKYEVAGKILEMRGLRKDDGEFAMELSLSLWSRRSEQFFTVIVRDITQRRLMEEEFLRTEKLLSMERLSAGISHEIINPLNAIAINLQLLLKYEALRPSSRQLCQIVFEEVERIREILEGLDTFAQQIKAELQLVSIQSALTGALDLLKTKVQRHEVNVVEEFLPSSPVVKGNSVLLQQAFKNLVDNALEAMPQRGTLTLRIKRGTREEMPLVNVCISDTGPGISRDHLRKVFDPFFTTREVGEGKGLGLSIALGIVKHHGGTILVDSFEGLGTTFTIELPLEQKGEAKAL